MAKKKCSFTQLTIEDREKIQELLREGCSLREIGRCLRRPHTTISRELRVYCKSMLRRYVPRLAQAQKMRKARGHRPRLKHPCIRAYVETKLKEGWSPEQIAGRLPKDHGGYTVSPEAIYLYIYSCCERNGYGTTVQGEDLRPYLRRQHKRRKRTHLPFPQDIGMIRNRTSIEERPKYIEQRRQLGHWEGDSIISRQSTAGLNTLVERVTGIVKITKLNNLTAAETQRAVTTRLRPLSPAVRRTVTTDNGHENAAHEAIAQEVNVKWYFCHPHASYERGTNENTNGLIRQYFPKRTDFATVSEVEIQAVEDRLNNRPRKRLKYQTPREVFNQRGALKR